MADNLMGCIFSSVDLDYVFDYCYDFTALGRARRARMTQIIIWSVFLYKYVLRKPVIVAIFLPISTCHDNDFLFMLVQKNISV